MACFLIKHLSSFQILLEKSMQHPKFTWWYSWPIPNPLLRRDFSVRLAMYTEDAGHVMQEDREGSWLALPASPRPSTVAGSHLHKLWSALPASPWVLAPSSNFNSRSFTAEKTWDRSSVCRILTGSDSSALSSLPGDPHPGHSLPGTRPGSYLPGKAGGLE